eukprot:COSAG04_NODE_788_length_10303_cov_33.536946_12_plen_68_part_00
MTKSAANFPLNFSKFPVNFSRMKMIGVTGLLDFAEGLGVHAARQLQEILTCRHHRGMIRCLVDQFNR